MNDSISRQAAIETVKKHYRVDNDLLEVIAYEIEALPPAQLAQDLTNGCTDTISRQAAVSGISDLLMLELKGERLPTYNEVYRAIYGLPPAQPGWIPTSERLPKTEEKVLITCERLDIYGKPHRYVCKAFHVDRYTMRSDVDWWDEGCDEYREEDDQYYVLEGWYEYIHNWGDYSSVRITEDKVVAWCELPKPWEGDTNAR